MALPLAPSVLAPSVDAYRHLAATQPPLPWLALPRMGTSTCSAASHSFIKTKLRDCCANHSLCAAADSGFLHRRGWVLQERLLFSRTIHFAKSEIVWHCLQDIGSESIPTRIIPHRSPSAPPTTTTTTTTQSAGQISDYSNIRITVAQMRQQVGGVTFEGRARLDLDWKLLITQYTNCGLTKGEDKLVAVFGIVDLVEQLTGDRCLAGMWRSQMPGCLLWLIDWGLEDPDGQTAAPVPNAPQRPPRWRAPSWSWASHDWAVGHIYCEEGNLCYAEIVGAAVVRRQNGSAVSATLTLRGPVIDVDIGGLMHGQIASGLCQATVLSVPVECLIRTDGPYDSMCRPKALLVMQDWAYFFLLIVPADPDKAEPCVFRRVGVLVMLTEPPEGSGSDTLDLLSRSEEGGLSRRCQHIKLVKLI